MALLLVRIVLIIVILSNVTLSRQYENFTLPDANISLQKNIVDIRTYPHSAQINPIETSYAGGNIVGYQPSIVNENGYPLYVYVTGTQMSYSAESAVSYTQYMAENGFVAVSADYSNAAYPLTCGQFSSKADLLWNQANSNSLLTNICNSPLINANCDLGIVTSGMSQGIFLCIILFVYDDSKYV